MQDSALGKVSERIHRLAMAANLKMKFDSIGIAGAHLCDALAFFDILIFAYQQLLIMGVGRQIGIVVFQDNQMPIAGQAGTRINHPAVGGCQDVISGFTNDINAFVGAFIEPGNHGPWGWPGKAGCIAVAGVAGSACGGSRRRGAARCGGRGLAGGGWWQGRTLHLAACRRISIASTAQSFLLSKL